MRFIPRLLASELIEASKHFPALILTGPRRSGKTTLLRKLFPKTSYYLLEDPDVISRLRADPRSFIGEIRPPAILDEIQNVPEIFKVGMQFTQLSTICCVWPPIIILRGTGRQSMACSIRRWPGGRWFLECINLDKNLCFS